MSTLKHIISAIIKLRVVIILVLIGAVIISSYKTKQNLQIDNDSSIWFLEDNPSYRAYIKFQEEFGSDEIYVGMVPVNNALDVKNIDKLKALHKDLNHLDFIKTSFSLATAKYPNYANNKLYFENLYNTKRSTNGLKSVFNKLPNVTKQLVTDDFKYLFFYIQLKPTSVVENKREVIASTIQNTITKHFKNYYLTGTPVLNDAYSKGIYQQSIVFAVLTIVFIVTLLLFLLPNVRYLPQALLSVAVPLLILFGIITSFGFALNTISMLIPTILMVYSVSDAVHIINIYHKEGLLNQHTSKIDLLTSAVVKSFKPCFYTTITTIVGYFALYLSPLPAFKDMGLFTCIGLLLAFILVYIIAIISFSFMHLKFKEAKPVFSLKYYSHTKIINWLNHITSTYKNTIIIIFSLLLLYGCFSVFKVEINTNSLDLLAEGKVKDDLLFVESKLNSSSRLQLSISSKGESMLKKKAIKQLEAFQNKLALNPLISNPVSVVNAKQFIEKRSPLFFQSNLSEEKISQTINDLSLKSDDFFKLFSNDYKTASITLGIKELKTSLLDKVLKDIKNDFDSIFNSQKYQLQINGFSVVFSQLNNFILQTQFKSFFAAFFVGFLCLLVFIRNIKTTILVLIPNVLPLAILAIFMSVLNIPLSISTAMITPIMLGIAMDDTIHLVYKYKPSKTILGTSEKRINNAMHYTGSALFSTTIALVAGFLVISTSPVPSVRNFGILCAVSVGIALITDIFYLPALLKKFDN